MRKRKPKVVWLPSDINNRLATAPSPATDGSQSQTIIKIFTGNPFGAVPVTEEIPIVKDFFVGAAGAGTSLVDPSSTLADIAQSGYRLRRIVGKLSFSVQQKNAVDDGDGSSWMVTAGFIIRRISDLGAGAGISLADVAGGAGGLIISTVSFDNVMDPWIWRRSWRLNDNLAILSDTTPVPNRDVFPPSNDKYGGGVLDGPHVDAKTARVVGPEERLFLSVTVEGLDGNAQGNPGAILMLGDLRVLASLKSNTGNRRNASR